MRLKKLLSVATLLVLNSAVYGQWTDNGATMYTNDYVQSGSRVYLPYVNGNNYIRPLSSGKFTYFDGGGNVGIGHQSQYAGYRLHVSGKTNLHGDVGVLIGNSLPLSAFDVNGQITMRSGAANGYIPVSNAQGKMTWTDPLSLGFGSPWVVSGNDAFYNPGNIGIGTYTSEDLLQVGSNTTKLVVGRAGGASLGWGTSYIGFNASRQSMTSWSTATDGANNGGAVMYGDIFGSIMFSTIPMTATGTLPQTNILDATVESNTRLFIHRDGNVGIGTKKVAGYKLSVDGLVRARELEVNTLTWADYVFDNDYKLMPLEDLSNFISENKHLPNIPTAEDIIENGLSVGEMQVKQMEKIEELTLYVLKLNEELDNLKRDNADLRESIKGN